MPRPPHLALALALRRCAGTLCAPPDAPVQRVESPLGVCFDLPAGLVGTACDLGSVQRFRPEHCAPDATPFECQAFHALQRMQPIADADAVAFSRRRAQAMRPAWRMLAEGTHADGSAWRSGHDPLGPVDAVHVVTHRVDGEVGCGLTGWSRPEGADAMAPVYMAVGATLRASAAWRVQPDGPALPASRATCGGGPACARPR